MPTAGSLDHATTEFREVYGSPNVLEDMETVDRAKALAVRWLRGVRDGSDRPSWKHPEDIVELLRQLPGVRPDLETQTYLEAVAWGHDLLEDGVREDGGKVTYNDLVDAGLPYEVVVAIHLLSKEPWMTEAWYARQVTGAPDLVRIIKCCDRIANLTEGAPVFDARRWSNYVRETESWILPMAEGLANPYGPWLAKTLRERIALRPVRPVATP